MVPMLSPERLDLPTALALSMDASLTDGAEVIIDFRRLSWVEPFAMLYIASLFRRLKITPIIAEEAPAYGYAAYMGFFKSIGIDIGEAPRSLSGKNKYSPISAIRVDVLNFQAMQQRRNPAELLTDQAGNLAKILTQSQTGPVYNIVTYAIREIMRNVIDHSMADRIWMCAQAWPESRVVEVALLDEGRGVYEALKSNPSLTVPNGVDAIRLAFLPGITGNAKPGKKHFSNSGYGLYVTRRLCADGDGSLLICSYDAAIESTARGESILKNHFTGTAVRMRLEMQALERRKDIAGIVREGEAEAKLHADTVKDASGASRGFELT